MQQESNSQQAVDNIIRYSQDPWAFLSECVYTQDQVDLDEPIKQFPVHFDYLYFFVKLWQREKLVAVPKSRRMTMSWTCISLNLWLALFKKGMHIAFVSKKEDDAADLVRRAEFIYNHIPEDKIPKALLPKIVGGKATKAPPVLEFEGTGSVIRGTAMGADQLRQFTFTSIFGDECAFWPEAEKFYAAAKPTLDGGGRMTLVSSRSPGFFKKIVFDKIDSSDYNFPEVSPAKAKYPMEGIEVWKNPKNRFVIMDLHYTANPAKRGREFREAIKQSMPIRDYMMEYEKNWQTFEGLAVYPDFRKDMHCAEEELKPKYGLPLLLGWDFGLTPACIVGQLIDGKLHIFREFVAQNKPISMFAPEVLSNLFQLYPSWNDMEKDFINFIDPAGFQKNQVDARTCVEVMRENGLRNIHPGPIGWEERRKAVEHYLLKTDREGAGFQINEEHCATLIEGFGGGYRYPDSANEIQPDKIRPLKDHYSHPHDALQYLAGGSRRKLSGRKVTVPRPSYKFGESDTSVNSDVPQHRRRELGIKL